MGTRCSTSVQPSRTILPLFVYRGLRHVTTLCRGSLIPRFPSTIFPVHHISRSTFACRKLSDLVPRRNHLPEHNQVDQAVGQVPSAASEVAHEEEAADAAVGVARVVSIPPAIAATA